MRGKSNSCKTSRAVLLSIGELLVEERDPGLTAQTVILMVAPTGLFFRRTLPRCEAASGSLRNWSLLDHHTAPQAAAATMKSA